MISPERLERRLGISGLLISSGLVLEAVTLLWAHPLSFVAFIIGGGTLVGLGIVLYLLTIVSA